MKTLVEYLTIEDVQTAVFEQIESPRTAQEAYESLGRKMLEDDMLCEGLGNFFRKLAGMGDKIDDKASKLKDASKEAIEKMSDAAKKAIENIKKEAGNKWDSIKDTYTAVIAQVDAGVQQSKEMMAGIVKAAGQKIEDVENTVASVYTAALEKGGELGKKVQEWAADKSKGAITFSVVSTFTMASLMAAKAGLNSSLLMDIMTTAGIK